jgi:hypothetical protein
MVNNAAYTHVAILVSTRTSVAVVCIRGYSLFRYQYGRKTMSEDLENTPASECTICYADHDEEIHQATLSIHRWFHHQVTHEFEDDALYLRGFDARLAAV